MVPKPFALPLDSYLARIDYAGPREPTLATLADINTAHVRSIPFENVDVLLGRTISIEPEAIARKVIDDWRGGYCFEQNTLFLEALRALGFDVTPVLARVRRNVPDDVRTPLTHMALIVLIDGRQWLADAGFGAVGSAVPLALDTDAPQQTLHEPHRLVRTGGIYMHQIDLSGEWKDVYQFTLEEQGAIDFELGNWFSCTHPRAHFKNNLIVARAGTDRRINIQNREFTTRWNDGRVETTPIDSHAQLIAILDEHFGLTFPSGTRIEVPGFPWQER